jgi:hypothetical protein
VQISEWLFFIRIEFYKGMISKVYFHSLPSECGF